MVSQSLKNDQAVPTVVNTLVCLVVDKLHATEKKCVWTPYKEIHSLKATYYFKEISYSSKILN